jgi:hypothetical protein
MKKILTILILMFTIFSFAQDVKKIEYPRYVIDSTGQKVVQMSIAQAMKLDNNSDLLALFEQLGVEMGNLDSVCIKVINDKNLVISSQKVEIMGLKEHLAIKDQEIKVLQNESFAYVKKIVLLEEQVGVQKDIVVEKNIQIRGLKTKMVFGGIIGGVIITTLTYLLIVK